MEVEDVVFSGLCSALAVLTPEQKEIGVLMIDLGGGTTDYVAYAGKVLATAGSLGVGGDHITNDIATAFGIPLRQAETLKMEWGRAVADPSTRSRRIDLPPEVGLLDPSVNMFGLHTVINARVDETLAMVKSRVESIGLLRQLGAGVALTGGGARLNGIVELAEDIFGLPCRVGVPRDVDGLAAVMEGPQYATAVGLARYGFQTEARESPSMWRGILGRFFGGK
jgi:cell division protein FtsA